MRSAHAHADIKSITTDAAQALTGVLAVFTHADLAGGKAASLPCIAQGLGQALMEHCVYEPGSGQLITASFMDYGLPRADTIPNIAVDQRELSSKNNEMSYKDVGEAGATGAPPALVNAVLNGLADLGVTHLDMPLWPKKIWRAVRAAQSA